MLIAKDDDIEKMNIKVDDMEKRTRHFGHQVNMRVGYPNFSTLCGHSIMCLMQRVKAHNHHH